MKDSSLWGVCLICVVAGVGLVGIGQNALCVEIAKWVSAFGLGVAFTLFLLELGRGIE